MPDRIKTPRGEVVLVATKSGTMRAQLVWNPGFAARLNQGVNRAQAFVDSEVLKQCEPYTPKKTGMLIASGRLGTVIGSGEVKWIAPYAKERYYRTSLRGSETGNLRGSYWFQRMKNVKGKDIVEGAKRVMGGEA